jgi:anti-anti-sigma factor
MELAPGWMADVERGPDWLFVRLASDTPLAQDADIANSLWEVLRRHLAHRMVIQLDELPQLTSRVLGQLAALGERIKQEGGMLRLCGLSPAARESLRTTRLDRLLPCYENRTAAVMGARPMQPR